MKVCLSKAEIRQNGTVLLLGEVRGRTYGTPDPGPMISENDEIQRERDRANLAWAILLALPLTFLQWMFLAWLLAHNPSQLKALLHAGQPPELVTSTSIIHMDKRPIPVPNQNITRPQVPVIPRPPEQPQKSQRSEQQASPKAEPTELAREVPNAPPQTQPAKARQQASLSEVLAQQEAAFAREAQQMNANRAPLSVATIDPNNSPRSDQTYHMDFSGLPHANSHGEGIITSTRAWRDHGYDCYYGHYTYQYPDGSTEEGNIPWPFCFAPSVDPLLRPGSRFPMPFPVAGYRLPPGTPLRSLWSSERTKSGSRHTSEIAFGGEGEGEEGGEKRRGTIIVRGESRR